MKWLYNYIIIIYTIKIIAGSDHFLAFLIVIDRCRNVFINGSTDHDHVLKGTPWDETFSILSIKKKKLYEVI